jgi:hypothetical protein
VRAHDVVDSGSSLDSTVIATHLWFRRWIERAGEVRRGGPRSRNTPSLYIHFAASNWLQATQQKNADQSNRNGRGERNPSAVVARDALRIRPTNFCGKRVDGR